MKKQKIVDAVLFFNELDLLELRFEELYDKVDYFLVVESTKTFTGKPKRLFLTKISIDLVNGLIKFTHILLTICRFNI
jgi:hypothetical protein